MLLMICKANGATPTNEQERCSMNTTSSRFDCLVARYYPAVYSFAARFTDDPREAVALTRQAFNTAQKQLQSVRNQTAVATVLICAVLRAGLAVA
jgi:DNA-directed RNA polymerase specialized sigma24 family protein